MNTNDKNEGLNIVIVHPCSIFRHSLKALFEQCGYKVTGLFENYESLHEKLDSVSINLLLVHYSQCIHEDYIKHTIEEKDAYVALLASSDCYHADRYDDMMKLIEEGVTGFLDLDESVHMFLSEIEDIASGALVISRNFSKFLKTKRADPDEKIEEILKDREIEILNMIATGRTNKEIAQELFISEHTVKAHVASILAKLNLKNRQQATAYIVSKRGPETPHPGDNLDEQD